MSTNQSIALRRLESLRDDARAATIDWLESGRLREWDLAARAALRQIIGNDSQYARELDNVWWEPQVSWDDMPQSYYDEAFARGRSQAVAILSAAIGEAKDYGTSDTTKSNRRTSERIAVATAGMTPTSETGDDAEKEITFRERIEHHWLAAVLAVIIATATVTVGVTWYIYVTPLRLENARLKEQLGTNQVYRDTLPKIVLASTWVAANNSVVLEDGQAKILVESIFPNLGVAHVRINPAVGDSVSADLSLREKYEFRSGGAEYIINTLTFSGDVSVQLSVTRRK